MDRYSLAGFGRKQHTVPLPWNGGYILRNLHLRDERFPRCPTGPESSISLTTAKDTNSTVRRSQIMAFNSGSGNPIGAVTGPVTAAPPVVENSTRDAVRAAVEEEKAPAHLRGGAGASGAGEEEEERAGGDGGGARDDDVGKYGRAEG